MVKIVVRLSAVFVVCLDLGIGMNKGLSNLKKLILPFYNIESIIFCRKVINTYRAPAFILSAMQGDEKYNKDAEVWKEEGHYQSSFYKDLDGYTMKFVDYVDAHIDRGDRVLDICCNQGRFLFELKKRGVAHLYGFDIMRQAIENIKKNDNFTVDNMHIEHIMAQDYFKNKSNDAFDYAITYSATIELIHPGFDIFAELSRTIKKGMFLVLNESGHAYPRFYRMLHEKNGFKIVTVKPWGDGLVLIHSVKR